MKAGFVRLQWENAAQTIATFFFKPAGTYRYEAGQYAVISLPYDNPDNRGINRTMTLSSSPDDELLAFTMRITNGGNAGSSSFKHALLQLKPSDEITVFESLGDLVLPLDTAIPLVFIAGGVGIASFTGMTSWLTQHGDSRDVQLHYVVARPEDVVMQSVFDDLIKQGNSTRPLNLTKRIYTPDVKRLTASDILAAARPDSLFYLSGTEKLVETLRQDLLNHGVLRSSIVFDYFDGYSEL